MNSPAVTRRLLPRLLPLLLLPWLASAPAQSADPSWVYLDNGQLRLGVNEAAGAAIGWFSPSGSDQNRLNVYDVGRYVQQSYYGDSDKSDWNGTPWTYNPVQGGSWKNVPSMLIESRRDGDTYYAKTRPRHWATGALLEEVVMEQWLRLDGRTASLRFRMTYSGSVSHHPRHQELPALFVDASLDTLVYCAADQPAWQNAPLTRRQPGFPNEYTRVSEPWAAWVNRQDTGLGILFPGTTELTFYRVQGARGPSDCSYLSPIRTLALTTGKVVEYEVVLALGTITELRRTFADHPANRPSPTPPTPTIGP